MKHGKYYKLIASENKGFRLNLKEVVKYKDLTFLFVKRNFVSQYKQTVLGPAWAVIQTFCFYSNIFERLADYYYHFSVLFVPLILSRKDYEHKPNGLTDRLIVNNSPTQSVAAERKRIMNYTIEDVDIITVLSFFITVFCVWRFISYTGSGADSLSPFYFFWQ